MNTSEREQLGHLYESLATTLDMPDPLYEKAVQKYQEVGVALALEDTTQGRNASEVYPQGSFNLGTVVRPFSDRDEYDIDLVYRRDLRKESTTQGKLKEEAGLNLEKHLKAKRSKGEEVPSLEGKRRCWTLTYSEGFHMDVLPAIPNAEGLPESILITDTELTHWQHSNPKGYAEWFKRRMTTRLQEGRAMFAKSMGVDVAKVPVWKVKTPLQRVVQILKRHRDSFFQTSEEDKPASILITTLAAKAYSEEADILIALDTILGGMEKFIEKRGGVHWVPNPVDDLENFADKWQQNPGRREKFFLWLNRVKLDLQGVERATSLEKAAGLLQPALGEGVVNEAAERLQSLTRKSGSTLTIAESVPALDDARHVLPPSWPVDRRYKAIVTAEVYNKAKNKKLWALSGRGVPKQTSLFFKIRTDVPPPYSVQWQVVNTGQEAALDKQLRGDFYPCDGNDGESRWESTKYAGTHWVEAFVVKDKVCVARSGRMYVRIWS